jgi:hypothetical protein
MQTPQTTPNPGGRPRALDDARKRGQIVALLSAGASRQAAAQYVQVHYDTLRRTLARDADFRAEVEQAEGQFENSMVMQVTKAAKDERHWRAAVWNLDTRHPERYRRRPPDMVTVEEMRQVLKMFARLVARRFPRRKDRRKILAGCDRLWGEVRGGLEQRRVRREVRRVRG